MNPAGVTYWHPQLRVVSISILRNVLLVNLVIENKFSESVTMELEKLMQCGKEMGLTGLELKAFVDEQQAIEREERHRRRQAEQVMADAELKKASKYAEAEKIKAEAETTVAQAEKDRVHLAVQLEKEKFRHEQERIRHEQELEVRASEKFLNEAAERQKERDHELKKLELRRNRQDTPDESVQSEDKFEWTKVSKLLPKFNEKDLSKFFLHFEKLMVQCECPEKFWTLLLQSVLTGKAQVAYSCMDVEVSKDYEVFKEIHMKILK